MDDGMLGGGMTLEGIGRQLAEMRNDIAGMKTDLAGVKTDLAGVKTDLAGVKTDLAGLHTEVASVQTEVGDVRADLGAKFAVVGTKLDAQSADIRRLQLRLDDTYHMAKLGLEAREALREPMEARFDEARRLTDEQIGLLKDVLRHHQG